MKNKEEFEAAIEQRKEEEGEAPYEEDLNFDDNFEEEDRLDSFKDET